MALIPNFSSDTPCIYLGGPRNRHVEDWGSNRGRATLIYHEGKTHEYAYHFILSDDKKIVELVLLEYQGSSALNDDR